MALVWIGSALYDAALESVSLAAGLSELLMESGVRGVSGLASGAAGLLITLPYAIVLMSFVAPERRLAVFRER